MNGIRERTFTRRAAALPACLLSLVAAPGAGDPSARARALHERALTIDSHGFIPPRSCGSTDLQVDFAKMRKGGLDAVFGVVYAEQQRRTAPAYAEAMRRAEQAFHEIHETVRRCHREVALARTPDDVERIAGSGKLAVVIGIENGFVLGRELSLLERYRDSGAAYIGLTHDGHNDIADSATPRERLGDAASEHGGVSAFGGQVIAGMNRLGILVDVSHMSKAATLDAIRLSRAPVIASHSSLHAIVPTPRNMDDETLLALAAKGGVIQVTAVHSFVKVDPPGATKAFFALLDEFGIETDAGAKDLPPGGRAEFQARQTQMERRWALATVAQMVDHIDYAVSLAGIDHVGIGSDFEGGGGLAGWADASETVNVTAELLRRGYTEEEIRKIWGGNLLRAWRKARKLSTP
ncbi:MAG TPA: dipeptidase [Candidatus Polarisedimenticolia bacterium]|nr:dipeptidase [Candidatus Polarisedimenticolia bacterium]